MSWQLSALDRAEIQELYARYAWGIDLADLDMALSTFVATPGSTTCGRARCRGMRPLPRT